MFNRGSYDGSLDHNDPAVGQTSPTYGSFIILTCHVYEKLDLDASNRIGIPHGNHFINSGRTRACPFPFG